MIKKLSLFVVSSFALTAAYGGNPAGKDDDTTAPGGKPITLAGSQQTPALEALAEGTRLMQQAQAFVVPMPSSASPRDFQPPVSSRRDAENAGTVGIRVARLPSSAAGTAMTLTASAVSKPMRPRPIGPLPPDIERIKSLLDATQRQKLENLNNHLFAAGNKLSHIAFLYILVEDSAQREIIKEKSGYNFDKILLPEILLLKKIRDLAKDPTPHQLVSVAAVRMPQAEQPPTTPRRWEPAPALVSSGSDAAAAATAMIPAEPPVSSSSKVGKKRLDDPVPLAIEQIHLSLDIAKRRLLENLEYSKFGHGDRTLYMALLYILAEDSVQRKVIEETSGINFYSTLRPAIRDLEKAGYQSSTGPIFPKNSKHLLLPLPIKKIHLSLDAEKRRILDSLDYNKFKYGKKTLYMALLYILVKDPIQHEIIRKNSGLSDITLENGISALKKAGYGSIGTPGSAGPSGGSASSAPRQAAASVPPQPAAVIASTASIGGTQPAGSPVAGKRAADPLADISGAKRVQEAGGESSLALTAVQPTAAVVPFTQALMPTPGLSRRQPPVRPTQRPTGIPPIIQQIEESLSPTERQQLENLDYKEFRRIGSSRTLRIALIHILAKDPTQRALIEQNSGVQYIATLLPAIKTLQKSGYGSIDTPDSAALSGGGASSVPRQGAAGSVPPQPAAAAAAAMASTASTGGLQPTGLKIAGKRAADDSSGSSKDENIGSSASKRHQPGPQE